MPRIRKKTSKRGTTNQREKIKHKVAGHRQKVKKQARKDKASGKIIQKKSKKDPGIPNNFPYKDQILAEVAEQRREAAAEKQRRKDEKRAAAAGVDVKDLETTLTTEEFDVGENDGQGFDGVMSLRSAPISAASKTKDTRNAVKEQTPAIPILPGPSTIRDVIQKADVVLHVVDARDPEAGISDALLKEGKDKSLVVLLNKADTVPRESLSKWLAHLRSSYTALPFRVSSAFLPSPTPFEPPSKKAKAIPMDDGLGLKALWSYLGDLAKTKKCDELVVAVTGVTNAGKTAVINSLLGADALSIYSTHMAASVKGPCTTTLAQGVVIAIPGIDTPKVRFVDTPGLQCARPDFLSEKEKEETRARDILLRCRGRIDRLKDPLFAVSNIISRADTQDLMLAYNLPAFAPGDLTGFLAGLARVSGLIKKRGVLDHAGAARIVLRDWSTGKFARYTLPLGTFDSASMEAGDEEVLATLRSRKELRKAGDVKLVKLQAGEVDKRDVEWDVAWEEDEGGSVGDEDGDEDHEEEDGDEEEVETDAQSETGDNDTDAKGLDEEEEAPELLRPPPTNRKRRVAFALPTRGEKRRRGESGPDRTARKGGR
ncbi:hypothetical protein BDN67DRAFT_961152 [Paxillus ammoniavirescens]|nr:hypothetical protein BDN67DRAFT_961152 [Paxillus ammoniavirescens]